MAELRCRKSCNKNDFDGLHETTTENLDLEDSKETFSEFEPSCVYYQGARTWIFIIKMICALCIAFGILYVLFFHYVTLGIYFTNAAAHLGYHHAQYILGQIYFQGKGVPKNRTEAFLLFRRAADQGHPQASYNLALGRFKGYHAGISYEEARQYMALAASKGVPQAKHVMETICSRGHCGGS